MQSLQVLSRHSLFFSYAKSCFCVLGSKGKERNSEGSASESHQGCRWPRTADTRLSRGQFGCHLCIPAFAPKSPLLHARVMLETLNKMQVLILWRHPIRQYVTDVAESWPSSTSTTTSLTTAGAAVGGHTRLIDGPVPAVFPLVSPTGSIALR